MGYLLVEVDTDREMPSVTLPQERDGLALIVWRRGRPIGFLMRSFPGGTQLSSGEVGRLVGEAAGEKLLQEQIRDELPSPATSMPLPAVTVAVCTRDHPYLLARCLASLREASSAARAEAPSVEIVVVDNAPPDERTRQMAARFHEVRYIREPRAGLDFARNRALAEAGGELLAFIDDDAVADRVWLRGLAEAWNENPDAGAFTGLVLPLELETRAQVLFEERGGFRRGFEKLRYQGQTLGGNSLYPCGAGIFGAGCNMAFRRDLLLELGGFDEALDTGAPLPGGGDLDIFYRVIRAGHALVYEPRFAVRHQHRRGYAELRKQYWSWGTGFMAFLDKSYRADPALRSRLRRTVGWWFAHQTRQVLRGIAGRGAYPLDLAVAELLGGATGILGGYRRSVARSDRIRERHG
ncbi:hypothetical protein BH20GEM2_BH20GEM2_17450 [soil metagenome]